MSHRRFRRWETRLPCHCVWELGQTGGHIINFSYGGAAVVADTAPPSEGDDLHITMSGGGQRVELKAHVTWQRGPQFGIEFYASAEERRLKLLVLFRHCLARETQPSSPAES